MASHSTTRGSDRSKRSHARRLIAVTVPALVLVVLLGVAFSDHRQWLIPALTHWLFLFCAAIFAVCALGIAWLGAALWQMTRQVRTRPGGEEGGVMLEVAMVLPIMLMMALFMAQSAFLMVGNVVVHYAAFNAARAAIVQIPRGLSMDEPHNVVLPPNASGKVWRIRQAAVWTVMPVSCGSEYYAPGDVTALSTGISDLYNEYDWGPTDWIDDKLGRKYRYAEEYTTVELSPPVDGVSYGEAEDVSVAVEHVYYLAVPYAGALFSSLPGGVDLAFAEGEHGMTIRAMYTLTNEGVQDYVDIETFPPN
ncbi:MAG: hypothetical protein ACLFVU_07805 [Phycisphaerae bacterium]